MNLFEDIKQLTAKSGVLPFHEVLTGEQYKELFKEAGFGLEFECGAMNDMKVAAGIRAATGSRDLKDFFSILLGRFTSEYGKFKVAIKNYETNSGYSGSAVALETFMKLTTPLKVFTRYSNAIHQPDPEWKIVPDGSVGGRGDISGQDNSSSHIADENMGMEFTTPMTYTKRGMTYDEMVTTVPKVVQCLQKMGLHGNKSTGLHINISVGNKLNNDAYRNFKTSLRASLNDFAIISYITTREVDALFAKGDYARKDAYYCKTFESSFNSYCKGSFGVGNLTMFEAIPAMVKKQLNDKTGLRYIIKVPVYLFATAKKMSDFPRGFQWLSRFSTDFLEGTLGVEKYVDLNLKHSNRVELRGFGGARAFDQCKDASTLGQTLRLALAQVYPFMDVSVVDKPAVLRAVQIRLREGLVPALNDFLKTNIVDTRTMNFTASTDLVRFAYQANQCVGFEVAADVRDFTVSVVGTIKDADSTVNEPINASPNSTDTIENLSYPSLVTKWKEIVKNITTITPEIKGKVKIVRATADLDYWLMNNGMHNGVDGLPKGILDKLINQSGMKVSNQTVLTYIPKMAYVPSPNLPRDVGNPNSDRTSTLGATAQQQREARIARATARALADTGTTPNAIPTSTEQTMVINDPLQLNVTTVGQSPVTPEDVDPYNIVHNPQDRVLVMGTGTNRKSFYLDQMKSPTITQSNPTTTVVAFSYDDGIRWKVKFANRADGDNLFNIITQYVARAQRGSLAAQRDATGHFRYRWLA